MLRVTITILLIMLVGCYNRADKPLIEGDLPLPTTTMGRLRSDIVGRGDVYIREDVVVHGRVISSDIEDNFYGSLVVMGDDGAVEVKAGLYSLEALYPEGLNVALRLRNCYAGYGNGILQVGVEAHSYDNFAVGDLASFEMLDRVVVRSTDIRVLEPLKRDIAELRREECGMLISVDDLHLVAASSVDTLAGESLEDAVWRGHLLFRDAHGDSIAVYTSDYARYANNRLPYKSLTLTGVLQWAKYNGTKECYHLKMRYERDCCTN